VPPGDSRLTATFRVRTIRGTGRAVRAISAVRTP
jgi:hypothetical protein